MKKPTANLTALCCALLLASVPALADDTLSASGLMLTPEQLSWKPNPRVAGLEVANILGDAAKPGPYVQRVKFPPGQIVQAHTHSEDRTYTVISGTWRVGWGKAYDPSKLTALPAGSFYTEPANVPHFIATQDEPVIVQISGTGPTAVHYVDPAHAPKK
jgi:quercetin dioxygenase-like cupin family protein